MAAATANAGSAPVGADELFGIAHESSDPVLTDASYVEESGRLKLLFLGAVGVASSVLLFAFLPFAPSRGVALVTGGVGLLAAGVSAATSFSAHERRKRNALDRFKAYAEKRHSTLHSTADARAFLESDAEHRRTLREIARASF